MSRTRAAVKSQPTPATGTLDRGLVRRLSKLKIEAAAAEKKIASSHKALYEVLADCLALVAKHGKDCAEYKQPVQNDDGNQEYPE